MSLPAYQQSVLPYPAIESMMTRLILTPSVFQEVRRLVDSRHFSASESHLAMLWRAMCVVYDKYNEFDYYQLRDAILLDMVTSGPLPPEEYDTLLNEPQGLLWWTLHEGKKAAANSDISMARELVRTFLTERMVYQSLQLGLASVNGGAPTAIQNVLNTAVSQQQAISQLDVDPIHSGAPETWDKAPLDIQPTTVSFLDAWMDGGPAPKEVIGLLGPTGAGKTMLAVSIICAIAERERALKDNGDATGVPYRPKVSYFVTYEQSKDELRHRLVSCACQIETSTITRLRNPETELTSARLNNLKSYEIDVFRRRNRDVADPSQVIIPGEYERLQDGCALLRDYVHIVDLSGTDPDSSRPGIGFVDEIESLISRDQERRGNPGVATVIVDYVNLAVGRYLAARDKDDSSALRKAISNFVDNLRFKVAGRFNTHVWALNQLNAKGNAGKPTNTTSHLQSSEGFAYSYHLTWCCALGTKDVQSNCLTLNFSKRRRAGEYVEPVIVHIVENMATMEDGRGRFVLSPSTGRIVPSSLAAQIQGPEEMSFDTGQAIAEHTFSGVNASVASLAR